MLLQMDSLKNTYALMPTKWRTNMRTTCTSAVPPGKELPAEQGSPGRWQWVNTPHPVQNWEGHNSANERETIKVMKTKARTEPNWQTKAVGRTRSITVMFRGLQKDQWNQSFVKKFTLASFLKFPYKKYCTYFFRKMFIY